MMLQSCWCYTWQRKSVTSVSSNHGASTTVIRDMGDYAGDAREYRMIERDYILPRMKIGDRFFSKIGFEDKRIGSCAAEGGSFVCIGGSARISSGALDEHVASSGR